MAKNKAKTAAKGLGSGMARKASLKLMNRGRQIDDIVNRATSGKRNKKGM